MATLTIDDPGKLYYDHGHKRIKESQLGGFSTYTGSHTDANLHVSTVTVMQPGHVGVP